MDEESTTAVEQGQQWVNPTTRRIREELEAMRAMRWEDGAVVRFNWDTYSYVAIYVQRTDRWYVSGLSDRGSVPRGIDGDQLVTTLLDRQCTDIAVATEWEAV